MKSSLFLCICVFSMLFPVDGSVNVIQMHNNFILKFLFASFFSFFIFFKHIPIWLKVVLWQIDDILWSTKCPNVHHESWLCKMSSFNKLIKTSADKLLNPLNLSLCACKKLKYIDTCMWYVLDLCNRVRFERYSSLFFISFWTYENPMTFNQFFNLCIRIFSIFSMEFTFRMFIHTWYAKL